eukprot:2715646-Pyramimonas_sp.AAC.1
MLRRRTRGLEVGSARRVELAQGPGRPRTARGRAHPAGPAQRPRWRLRAREHRQVDESAER